MENEKTVKPGKSRGEIIELIIVIFLGITAVATAWSAWQQNLHGGLQNQMYTTSTQLTAEGNSMYNEAANYLSQDMNIWNQISSLRIDLAFAEDMQDAFEVEKIEYKLDQIMADNVFGEFEQAIEWADAQTDYASPFDNEDFVDSYFVEAQEKFAEAELTMELGNTHGSQGDSQGLVTVLLAVVLFLLGIAASYKREQIKIILLSVAVVGFVGATAVMLTIPIVLP